MIFKIKQYFTKKSVNMIENKEKVEDNKRVESLPQIKWQATKRKDKVKEN